MLKNNGTTTVVLKSPQATTLSVGRIAIDNNITLPPKNVAGHEAFHFWKGLDGRDSYIETVLENLDFTSETFQEYQSSISRAMFQGEVDLSDQRQFDQLMEELYAYISGDIHEGTNEAMLRPMFRDFDAVRAAWEQLVEENRGGITRSRYSRKDLTKEEEGALLRYKSGESYQINAKLRDEVLLTESEQKMVDELDRALEKLPTHEGVVYRRLSFDMEGQEALDAFLASHEEKTVARSAAYISSSTAMDGYPVSGELTITQIITSRTGRDMAGIGNNNESEILFARNTRFYVEKIETDADGETVIYMEEVTKNGAGQLYSEEYGQTVQQMQTSEGEDGELQNVSGVDTRRGADRGGMSGLRAEGDGEEGGIARESRKGFSVDRELDREIRQIVKEAREGGRSEEAVQADVRALVRRLTGAEKKAAQTAEGKLSAALEAGARHAETLRDRRGDGTMDTTRYSLKEAGDHGRAREEGPREETREDFLRRSVQEGLEVIEGEGTAYGFRRAGQPDDGGTGEQTSRGAQTQQEMTLLGIPADVIDGPILRNRNGFTDMREVEQAVTVARSHVFISKEATLSPRNIAGHEAFHLWKSGAGREAYIEALEENLDFSGEAFRTYQSDIALTVFGQEADLTDETMMERFTEELYAYISGDIHEGTNETLLRPMFRDFDAVRAAWENLVEENRGGTTRSKYSLKEDGDHGRTREETRGAFLRRAAGAGYAVYEGETAGAYGYRRVDRESARENAGQIQAEISNLGIEADIISGPILINRNGKTIERPVSHAVTIDRARILVNENSTLPPRNVAGHEAFHLWKSGVGRDAYIETVEDNLDFTSDDFRNYQSAVSYTLFGEEADLNDDRQMARLREELFAYISGDIHEGANEANLRPMFRDFDAVRAAWETLVEENRGGITRSRYSLKEDGANGRERVQQEDEGILREDDARAEEEDRGRDPGDGEVRSVPIGERYRGVDPTYGENPVRTWVSDGLVTPEPGSLAESEQQTAAEYGIPSFVVSDAVWDQNKGGTPAFSAEGQIFLRENLPEAGRGTYVPHEATHVMKQMGYQPYLDFTQRVPDMLDLSSTEAHMLLNGVGEHRGIDPLDMTEEQAGILFDEVNAIIYGSIAAGDEVLLTYVRPAFQNFDAYAAELSSIHEQFKREHGDTQARESRKGFSVDRELDREIRQIVKEAREGGRSEEAVQADIRTLVRRLTGAEKKAAQTAEEKLSAVLKTGAKRAETLRERQGDGTMENRYSRKEDGTNGADGQERQFPEGAGPEEAVRRFYAEAEGRGQTVRVFQRNGQTGRGARSRLRLGRFTEVTADAATETAVQTKADLEALGIPAFIHAGDLEVMNKNGEILRSAEDSATVNHAAVGIANEIQIAPKETAGHEAYHFWKGSRPCLKIGNVPNGERFFRQTRRFDAAILCVLQGKSTQYGGKRSAVWAC